MIKELTTEKLNKFLKKEIAKYCEKNKITFVQFAALTHRSDVALYKALNCNESRKYLDCKAYVCDLLKLPIEIIKKEDTFVVDTTNLVD